MPHSRFLMDLSSIIITGSIALFVMIPALTFIVLVIYMIHRRKKTNP